MSALKIILLRHGQTNYNVLGLHNSDPSVDVHLTHKGTVQSQIAAGKLEREKIQNIFISELNRTKQTADIVNRYHQVPITVDSRLNDSDSGFESQPDAAYHAELQRAKNKWTKIRFNDGESLEDVRKRVQSFINDLRYSNHNTCLIVTSAIIIGNFYGIVHGSTCEQIWEYNIKPGDYIMLEL